MKPMQPMTLEEIERAPFFFRRETLLPAPPDVVFAQLAAPERWLEWFPLMRRAAWTSATRDAVGAEREVALRVFGGFAERFVAWEPGRRYAFTMTASNSPLVARMAEDWHLRRDGGGTRIEWRVGAHPTKLGNVARPALQFTLTQLFERGTAKLGRLLEQRGTQVA